MPDFLVAVAVTVADVAHKTDAEQLVLDALLAPTASPQIHVARVTDVTEQRRTNGEAEG
jgi:hypothetical protein